MRNEYIFKSIDDDSYAPQLHGNAPVRSRQLWPLFIAFPHCVVHHFRCRRQPALFQLGSTTSVHFGRPHRCLSLEPRCSVRWRRILCSSSSSSNSSVDGYCTSRWKLNACHYQIRQVDRMTNYERRLRCLPIVLIVVECHTATIVSVADAVVEKQRRQNYDEEYEEQNGVELTPAAYM